MTEIKVSNFNIEVIHKYQEEATPLEYNFYFSGLVEENTVYVDRQLYAFSATSNKLVGKTYSNEDGTFLLPVTTSGVCYITCLSNKNTYNHLIAKQISPLMST